MDISVKHGQPAKLKSSCIIAVVFSGKTLSNCAQALDRASRQSLSNLVKRGDISGKVGESLMIPTISSVAADRVLLIGGGKRAGITAGDYLKIVRKAAAVVSNAGLRNALSALSEITVKDRDDAWKLRQQLLAFDTATYRFNAHKSKNKSKPQFSRLTMLVNEDEIDTAKDEARIGESLVNGLKLTRDLANTPANYCTPTDLANEAKSLGKRHATLKVDVLSEAAMEKLGMGSLLSVSRGSEQPAKLITMQYSGAGDDSKPVVLVGKGVTFDSGGISLKPGPAMDEMKYDMCGAATVFGVMSAVVEAKLPINVVGVVPATENLPDGKATKPGDVVTSMSGQTIEVLNTDAEGRLILCDALTYCARYNPDVVIDIATLTGACIIALGHIGSALMSNDDELAEEILNASTVSGDRAWQLPLWDEYQQQIDSPFADIANVGGRAAGSITAACFLSRFTKDFRWAHLDIAGTAWKSSGPKGATGRPVPLLVEFLRQRIPSE